MSDNRYTEFVRLRITELRLQKNVSEHKMSLDLGKSGSYIRGITNGASSPSLRELFNILDYFDITPTAFFAPMEQDDSPRCQACARLRTASEDTAKKILTVLDWLET